MKIAIDARFWGGKDTGLGIYTKNLVEALLKVDRNNEYVLLQTQNDSSRQKLAHLGGQAGKAKTIIVTARAYTLREQILLPWILYKERVDLAHFPSINIPILYFRPFVMTAHDLIKHRFCGFETTTRSSWVYWLKYGVYRFVSWWGVKRARFILAPSKSVKKELVEYFGLDPEKVVITLEAPDSVFAREFRVKSVEQGKVLKKYQIKTPYLLYVGNLYPHKNFERLLKAFQKINDKRLKLAVVCGRSVFQKRMIKEVQRQSLKESVIWTGLVKPKDLPAIYKNARGLVLPTLAEGFGLTGLEAMAVGCPVICSKIEVLGEIYGDAALYFDPYNVGEITEKINWILADQNLRKQMAERGKKQVAKYSWDKTARRTLEVYGDCFGL